MDGRQGIARLHYAQGAEFGPAGRFGAHALTLLDEGHAVIERRRLGSFDAWEVTTAECWREHVHAALQASPLAGDEEEPPLLLHADQTPAVIEWNGRRRMVLRGDRDPRWAPLITLLEAPLWLVCPEYLPGRWPTGLDQSWVGPCRCAPASA